MMSYAKLVLLVIMLWTGFFTLVNSDQLGCNKYNIPKTAVWVPRDTCEVSKSNPCNAGFQLQIQTTCNDNGEWDVEPSCQVKDCGDVPQGTFSTGTATSGTTYPNVADYTCNVGHEVVRGNSTISCLASGQWDVDNVLVCEAKDCGDLPPGTFSTGTATSGTTYPNVADYTCDVGHEIVSGNEEISCLASGEWSDDNGLVCRAVECPIGGIIENSDEKTKLGTYDEEYIFNCSPGYTRNGLKGTLRCGKDGDWIIKAPCEDCYIYGARVASQFIENGGVQSESACNDMCNNYTGNPLCSIGLISDLDCLLFPLPIITIAINTDLNTCKLACGEMEYCAAFGHSAALLQCYILNVTMENFPNYFNALSGGSDRIRDKLCL